MKYINIFFLVLHIGYFLFNFYEFILLDKIENSKIRNLPIISFIHWIFSDSTWKL